MALMLWNSFNIVFVLLQEVISIYKLLSPLKVTSRASHRVCNALVLFQCMAAHPATRMGIIRAHIPVYLYPFLKTTGSEKQLEFLRLTSLGVIGALVKFEDPNERQIMLYLLETEMFPWCLRCMDVGNQLTQTVATLIILKILLQEDGLKYCSAFADRYFAIVQVLGRLVEELSEKPCVKLLKYVIRCFLRLSEVPRLVGAYHALWDVLPAKLCDNTFMDVIREDSQYASMLQQLLSNVSTSRLNYEQLVSSKKP